MAAFVHRMPVRFADVDHAGIVYYPKFFDYFHIAFEEFFIAAMGSRGYVELLDKDRVGFPSVHSTCDFRTALRFGDAVEIEMTVVELGTKSVTFGYRIFRAADDDAGERVLAAEGTNTCAVVDLDAFRAVRIPDRLLPLFADLQASS